MRAFGKISGALVAVAAVAAGPSMGVDIQKDPAARNRIPIVCESCQPPDGYTRASYSTAVDEDGKAFSSIRHLRFTGNATNTKMDWVLRDAAPNLSVTSYAANPVTSPGSAQVFFPAAGQSPIFIGPGGTGNGAAAVDFNAMVAVDVPPRTQAGLYYAFWVREDVDGDGVFCEVSPAEQCGYLDQTSTSGSLGVLGYYVDNPGPTYFQTFITTLNTEHPLQTPNAARIQVEVHVWPVYFYNGLGSPTAPSVNIYSGRVSALRTNNVVVNPVP